MIILAVVSANAALNGIKGMGKGFQHLASQGAGSARASFLKGVGRSALRSAGMGAAVGAAYGALDKNTSVLDGAIKGGVMGGISGGLTGAGYISGRIGHTGTAGKLGFGQSKSLTRLTGFY